MAWSPPRVKIRGVLETLVLEASRPETTLAGSQKIMDSVPAVQDDDD